MHEKAMENLEQTIGVDFMHAKWTINKTGLVLKGTELSKNEIDIFYPTLKEIECNQSYCNTKHRSGAICNISLDQWHRYL